MTFRRSPIPSLRRENHSTVEVGMRQYLMILITFYLCSNKTKSQLVKQFRRSPERERESGVFIANSELRMRVGVERS
jgi:hypothetical protein